VEYEKEISVRENHFLTIELLNSNENNDYRKFTSGFEETDLLLPNQVPFPSVP
jgi:hypothetical protein